MGRLAMIDREYHGPSGAMIIEENKRLKVVVEKLVGAIAFQLKECPIRATSCTICMPVKIALAEIEQDRKELGL